ncbi:hypothetical protein F5148DRAFT_1244044 [Russula earlei]|uniref:Uncharacterized protein n=1 Tax=Russula earlei TaxID=71964 RepID=A0ACC0TVK1_9AGAM|nr:hypothetical protein F5148DRAFT_1244044 [Russula earlei]
MTNEELASLEPIIAQAWDQWDHQQTISAHSFIARSSRRPFASCSFAHRSDVTTGVSAPLAVVSPQAASVPALPATLPPQFLALSPSQPRPPLP